MMHLSASASCFGLLLVALGPGIAFAAGGVPPLIQSIQLDNNYHSLETGAPFIIPCTIDMGVPVPEINWFKDGVV